MWSQGLTEDQEFLIYAAIWDAVERVRHGLPVWPDQDDSVYTSDQAQEAAVRVVWMINQVMAGKVQRSSRSLKVIEAVESY